MPETFTLHGKTYALVAKRRNGTAVYRGDQEYVRIGHASDLEKDLTLHKKMEALGFPIARLIEEGDIDDWHYFIESSVGNTRLNDAFAEDTRIDGAISDAHFEDFLRVALSFSEAQLKTVSNTTDIQGFARAIQLDTLFKERPDLEVKTKTRFNTALKELAHLPYVLTHGDFNPANMYAGGIIDLEDSFQGPLGYDAVTALVTTEWFPDADGFEYKQRYQFTKEQQAEFVGSFDEQFISAGYPPLSETFDALAFCRAIWHIVRMQHSPKVQRWRYDLFIKKYLP